MSGPDSNGIDADIRQGTALRATLMLKQFDAVAENSVCVVSSAPGLSATGSTKSLLSCLRLAAALILRTAALRWLAGIE